MPTVHLGRGVEQSLHRVGSASPASLPLGIPGRPAVAVERQRERPRRVAVPVAVFVVIDKVLGLAGAEVLGSTAFFTAMGCL